MGVQAFLPEFTIEGLPSRRCCATPAGQWIKALSVGLPGPFAARFDPAIGVLVAQLQA